VVLPIVKIVIFRWIIAFVGDAVAVHQSTSVSDLPDLCRYYGMQKSYVII